MKVIGEEAMEWIRALCERWHTAGVSVSCVRLSSTDDDAGKEIWEEETFNHGLVNSFGKSWDSNSRFCIASNSKLFTAIAIGLLIKDGVRLKNGEKFDWTSKLKDVFPGKWSMMDIYAQEHVDVIDLLSMRTGLPGHDSAMTNNFPTQYLQHLPFLNPSAELRQAWQYNNICFCIAAEIVTSLSGIPFHSFVESRLLSPLGMKDSTYNAVVADQVGQRVDGFFQPEVQSVKAKKAWSMLNLREEPISRSYIPPRPANPTESLPIYDIPTECVGESVCFGCFAMDANLCSAGDGGLWTSSVDMLQWLRELLKPNLIPYDVLQIVRTPHALPRVGPLPGQGLVAYGCGVEVSTYHSHRLFSHTGDVPGQHSRIVVLPDLGWGLSVACNDDTYGREICRILAFELMDRQLGKTNNTIWEGYTIGQLATPSRDVSGDMSADPRTIIRQRMSLPHVPSLAGLYSHPTYPSFHLEKVASDSSLYAQLATIKDDLDQDGRLTWEEIYFAPYDAQSTKYIIFVQDSGWTFVWALLSLYEERFQGQQTGRRWLRLRGSGGAVFSCEQTETDPVGHQPREQQTMCGLGMFGNFWEQGPGTWVRPKVTANVNTQAEVWFARQLGSEVS